MPHYLCRMVDYDGDDDWAGVSSVCAEGAAQEYAEHCDDRSGGTLLQDYQDRQIILVKEKGSEKVERFEISIDYSKIYYANEMASADT